MKQDNIQVAFNPDSDELFIRLAVEDLTSPDATAQNFAFYVNGEEYFGMAPISYVHDLQNQHFRNLDPSRLRKDLETRILAIIAAKKKRPNGNDQ